MEISLDGKVALVTGCGPNIGSAIALLLSQYGARVACNDMRQDAADACVRRIERAGGTSHGRGGDAHLHRALHRVGVLRLRPPGHRVPSTVARGPSTGATHLPKTMPVPSRWCRSTSRRRSERRAGEMSKGERTTAGRRNNPKERA